MPHHGPMDPVHAQESSRATAQRNFQVLIYRKIPKAETTYKEFNLSRHSCYLSDCSEDSKMRRVRLMKQVQARLTSKHVSTVLVLFLDILSTAAANKIIDTEFYDKAFDYIVEQVLEVHKNISQKKSPYACAT